MPHTRLKLLNRKPYTAFSICCTICCDSDLPAYSTVRLFAFQREIPVYQLLRVSCRVPFLSSAEPFTSLQSAFITGSDRSLNSVFADVHGDTFFDVQILFLSNSNNRRSENYIVLSSISVAFAYPMKEEIACSGGLGEQALKNGSTSQNFFIVSSAGVSAESFRSPVQLLFLLYSHWFTGMPLLHIKAHVLEVMNLMKTLSMDCCARRRSCDGLTTSLIAQSIVHFHVSRHSLRPDLSQPLECMPCFQSSARVNCPAILSRRFHEYSCYQLINHIKGFRRWYALNGIIISEAKANTTEDSCQLCQRIDDSSLPLDPILFLCCQFIINVAARRASDDSQRLTAQAAAQLQLSSTSVWTNTVVNLVRVSYKPEISFSGSKIKIAPIVTQRDPQRRVTCCCARYNANTVVDDSEPASQLPLFGDCLCHRRPRSETKLSEKKRERER
ncbi:hypothetical protein T01_6168 [Trichinella spiralis]|uniref:Uncharacterized protein n=1 Tax=Trichinella spiralis TaxID=6334 RepID=A0A0V1BT39_TRISP|nr:hypothetical protein T01_6168 [Trichinella spiralis]